VANAAACTGTFLDSSGVFTGYSGNYTNNTGTFAADSGLFKDYCVNFACVVTYGEFSVVVAKGDVNIGDSVITNSDCTVTAVNYEKVVTGTLVLAESIPSGVDTSFHTAQKFLQVVLFDPSYADRFIIVSSSPASVVVGTISDNVITFGATYEYETGSLDRVSAAFNPAVPGEFVITYRDVWNTTGVLNVGTISGTEISFSGTYVFANNDTYYSDVKFDPAANGRFFVSAWIAPSTYEGTDKSTLSIGTMSEGVPTFISPVVFKEDRTLHTSIAFDTDTPGRFVVGYIIGDGVPGPGVNYGAVKAGTISGDTVTFGLETQFSADSNRDVQVLFNTGTPNTFVVLSTSTHTAGESRAIVGTLSGTSTSFGSSSTFNSGGVYNWSGEFDPSGTGRLLTRYQDGDNGYEGTLSTYTLLTGNSVSHNSDFTLDMWAIEGLAFDPHNIGKFVYTYSKDVVVGAYAAVGQLDATIVTYEEETNLTEDNFTGIAEESFTDGQSGRITPKNGTVSNLTGLIPGTTYYVLADGSISDTPDMLNVVIGIGLSSTSLLLT
jgi:hypothetical protein